MCFPKPTLLQKLIMWEHGSRREFIFLLSATLAQIFASIVASHTQQYAVFLFPPPDHCFAKSAYLSVALSDGLFRAGSQILDVGLDIRIKMNGHNAASMSWRPHQNVDPDEGLAYHVALPELADGEYVVTMELYPASVGEAHVEGDMIGGVATTSFFIDTRRACLESSADVEDEKQCVAASRKDGQRRGDEKTDYVLVNVATGRHSWQSSTTSEQHGARVANDGETMLTSRWGRYTQTVRKHPCTSRGHILPAAIGYSHMGM
jgi:hypothetical protein